MNNAGPTSRAIELKINILSAVLDNNQAWGMKAALSSQAFPVGAGSETNTTSPVTVFGWLDQAPPNIEIRNNRLSQQTTALVYTTLNFKLPEDGSINLPVGMVPGSLTKLPRDGGPCGPNNMASVSMGTGEAEFEFQVPGDISSDRLNSLKLNLWRDSGGDWALPELSLWDWQAGGWSSVQNPILGINEFREPEALVSENGKIRVRLKNDNNMYACYFLDMGLDAVGRGEN
jgi:hypothetical protein